MSYLWKWLTNQLVPERKTEPHIIHSFKVCYNLTIYLGCAVYLCFLVYSLTNDAPLIQQSRQYPQFTPAPHVVFQFDYEFTVSCVVYSSNQRLNPPKNCTNSIVQPVLVNNSGYMGWYQSGANFSAIDQSGVSQLTFMVNVTDPRWDENSPSLFAVKLYDPDYSNDGQETHWVTDHLNTYILGAGQRNIVYFQRFLNNTLIPSWRNTIGIPPMSYRRDFYINSKLQSFPAPKNISATLEYARLSVLLQSKEVGIITEVSGSTFLKMFSALGGVFSLTMVIYEKIFGVSPVGTFGFMHHLPGIRNQVETSFKENFQTEPPFSSRIFPDPTSPTTAVTNEKDSLDRLEKRQLNLELFLREHIIDVRFMDSIGITREESLKKKKTWIDRVRSLTRTTTFFSKNSTLPL